MVTKMRECQLWRIETDIQGVQYLALPSLILSDILTIKNLAFQPEVKMEFYKNIDC